MPRARGAACLAACAFSATTQPGLHRPRHRPGVESPPGTSGTLITQKLLDAQEPLLLLWGASGGGQFSLEMTPNRSPPPGTSETIPRPSSGRQHFPVPTASPKASQPPHASHPLHQGGSCSRCSWKCCLQHDSPPSPHTLGWADGPKGTYPQEEAQSLGAMQAVAERHEEGAVCSKDPYPARAAAHNHLACPGPTRLAGQHCDRRKRQHPTEQWDITSPTGCGDRQHLAKDGMLWGQRQLLGQEKDRALDLAGATQGRRGGDSAVTLGGPQMKALSLSQKVSSQLPPAAMGKSGQSMMDWLKNTS